MRSKGSDYSWVPFHGAWLVRREPIQEPPETIVANGARFGDEIELLGYTLDTPLLAPGMAVSLRVYWRPLQRAHKRLLVLRSASGTGRGPGSGGPGTHLPRLFAGTGRVDTYQFPLLLQTPPGQYPLITGFYYAQGGGWQRLNTGGQDHLALVTLDVRAVDRPPVTGHPLFARLAEGPELVGVDFDRTVPGQIRVYLHWWQPPPWAKQADCAPCPGRGCSSKGEQVLTEGIVARPGARFRSHRCRRRRLSGPHIYRWPFWRQMENTGLDGTLGLAVGTYALPSIPDDAYYVPLGGEMAFVGLDNPPHKLIGGQQHR